MLLLKENEYPLVNLVTEVFCNICKCTGNIQIGAVTNNLVVKLNILSDYVS